MVKGVPLSMNKNDLTMDALTVAQALRDLGPRERDEITGAVFNAALQALPEADRLALQRLANTLSDRVRGVGDRMALDILGAVGVLWAGRP